jgi:hypothetical protein
MARTSTSPAILVPPRIGTSESILDDPTTPNEAGLALPERGRPRVVSQRIALRESCYHGYALPRPGPAAPGPGSYLPWALGLPARSGGGLAAPLAGHRSSKPWAFGPANNNQDVQPVSVTLGP